MNLNDLFNENANPFQDVIDKLAAQDKKIDREHRRGLKDIERRFQKAEKKSAQEFSKKLRSGMSEGDAQSSERDQRIAQGWAAKHPNIDAEITQVANELKRYGDYERTTSGSQYANAKQLASKLNHLKQIKAIIDSVKEGVAESAEGLNIGDDVVITGNVEFNGATGVIDDFGQDKRFVIVNLYNHGKHSFHSSDVSFNDYADSDEEEARMHDSGEFRDDMDEAALDPSGLQAAAQMVRDYIVTAEVDGKVKKFRVRGMTGPRSARERFLKHHSMAKVVDVKPEHGVDETASATDYNPPSQGGTRKELLAKYRKTKDSKDAEAARKAGATQKELQGVAESSFATTMKKAIDAHERGDHKRAKYHLDNAKTARYGLKSTEIGKHKDLLDKYKELRDMHEQQGVDEGQEDNPVANAITNRILRQRADLLQKYGPFAVGDAIDSVAEFVGDVEEIGSSDVSAWVSQVERNLSGFKDELNELKFLGSECTKDCSGHRAGYEWSKSKGLQQANSPWSPSFNKGAALAVAGK